MLVFSSPYFITFENKPIHMNDKKYEIELRPTTVADLDILFQFQLDLEGRHLAAFMSQDSTHKEAYLAKYTRLLNDPTVNNQTIIADSEIVGSIAKFVMEGDAELTYWIDRQFWERRCHKRIEKFP
jgi:hypothetical protein